MRPYPWKHLDRHRVLGSPWGSDIGERCGLFEFRHPSTRAKIRVIAHDGLIGVEPGTDEHGWEHVSVSTPARCPNWTEMSLVKDLFWLPEETVFQLHVPASDHVNFHPHTLHLWRHVSLEVPRPPAWLVGPATRKVPA